VRQYRDIAAKTGQEEDQNFGGVIIPLKKITTPPKKVKTPRTRIIIAVRGVSTFQYGMIILLR